MSYGLAETPINEVTAEFPQLEDRLLVLYDGQCGLCNHSIRWLLRRDRRDRLRFAPSNDPAVQPILLRHGYQPANQADCRQASSGSGVSSEAAPDTILVLRHVGTRLEDLLVRSNAILACMRVLPQPWPVVPAILRLVPRPLRDSAYRLIARWRYRIWGHYQTCPIPTAEERQHFL